VGRITRAEEIRRKQETLAIKMQEKALAEDALIDTMLDVFDRVTKWAAVSNKLEDQGESDIDKFKRRINGESPADFDKPPPPSRRPRGYVAPPAKQPRLDVLRARLPTGSAGSSERSGDGAVGEADSAA
jgi:hypothetical protein